jgi:Asp/Glu/hydantoin racemase
MTTPNLNKIKEEIDKKTQEVTEQAKVEVQVAKDEVKSAKKEVKCLKDENEELKKLLIAVLQNQTNSKFRDWINIACWGICFTLLIVQAIKG